MSKNSLIRIAIILNGISGKKKKFRKNILPHLEEEFSVEVFETTSGEDAFRFAANAVEQKFDFILAAGGDGTLHQVVNGMLTGNEAVSDLPVLGLIPIGTGNDFARALLHKTNIHSLKSSIQNGKSFPVDIGKVNYVDENTRALQTRYFINVVDTGMGPDVVKRIGRRSILGGAWTYYKAILKTFFHYRLVTVKATTPDWSWEGKVRTIAVANGNYFGQGLCIAPQAKPTDRLFSAFICGNVSVFEFVRYSVPLKMGKQVIHPEVYYKNCIAMELSSKQPCGIEADGEFLGMLPAQISMIGTTIRFLI